MDGQPNPDARDLTTLARRLRAAATDAGRTDVAAKADEIIALLAPAVAEPADRRPRRGDTVVRLLDGLGF